MFINTLALLSTLTLSVMAQDSLSTSYFFGPPGAVATGFQASVVNVDSLTTLAVSVPAYSTVAGGIVTFTLDASNVQFSTSTMVSGIAAQVAESCTLSGTTQAVCAQTISVSTNGYSTQLSATSTLTGDEVVYRPVSVTAGASKLAAATTGTTASSVSGSGSSAASSGVAAATSSVAPTNGAGSLYDGRSETMIVMAICGAAAVFGGLMIVL